MATKIKGLQQWCRKMTDGYSHVDVNNFTTSWRDGMAFCAIIHRFRPDLIDYDSLLPENVFENNKMAFEVAESELNIPAFLEADDMARLKVPDKLSVITYVSQYYNYLHQLPQLGGPGVKGAVKKGTASAGTKRPPDDTKVLSEEPSNKKLTVSSKDDAKNATKSTSSSSPRKGTTGDKCQICDNKVYLLERHIEGGKLYHRSCFRHSELSPTNKVYTKSPFMSPALSKEKATLEQSHKGHHATKDKVPPTLSNDKHKEDLNSKKGGESSVLTGLRSGLKRVDGGMATKHSIQDDKEKEEEVKKAKVQPRALFGGKENLNTEQKSEDLPFPLSGKEAKKLEKRRQEIISSESPTPVNKGAKRGVPLIFQSKDTNHSLKSNSNDTPSNASPISTSSSTLSSVDAKRDDKEGSSGLSNANLNKSSISVDVKPTRLMGGKDNKTDIDILQRKISDQNEPSIGKDVKTKSTPQPVARPRVAGSKIASSPFMEDNSSVKNDTSDVSVTVRNNKEAVLPKAAVRKSLFEIKEKEADKVKSSSSHNMSNSSVKSLSSEENTPRSSQSISPGSSPPPALPLSPPPSLPSSKPPPLPTSLPPARPPPLSLSSTNKSSHSTELPSKSKSQMPVKDKKDRQEFSTQQPKLQVSSTSTPSSSSSASSKPARPSVGPIPKQQPADTLVSPTEKKDEGTVLNGLLASLAGVRGRSASTPTILTDTPLPRKNDADKSTISTTTPKTISTVSTTPTTTSSSSSSSSPPAAKRKHSEPAVKLLSSSSVTPGKISLNPTPVSSNQSSKSAPPEAMNILNSLKHVSQTNHNSKKTNAGPSSTVRGNPPTGRDDQQSKLKSTNTPNKDQTKVGNLVKNYLSKSKEDLSSKVNTTTGVESKTEDIFKKPLKPVRVKDEQKSETSSSAAKMSPKGLSGSRENLTHVKDIRLKPVPSQSKPQDFQGTSLDKVTTSTNHLEEKEKPKTPAPNSTKDIITKGKEYNVDSNVSSKSGRSDGHDIPQWKKDIEERKRKLREDIVKSETPTKWKDRYDKETSQSKHDALSSGERESKGLNLSSRDEPVRSDITVPNKLSPHSVSNLSPRGDKLNWQKEAERRMAAFAMFDSSEDESKPQEVVEEKFPEVRTKGPNGKKADVMEKSDLKAKLKEVEALRRKVVLKPVSIDISIDQTAASADEEDDKRESDERSTGTKELSKPMSINNNNNTQLSHLEEKTGEVTVTPSKDKSKDDGKALGVTDWEKPKKSSPKIRRKITVLGQNQEEISTPPPPRSLALADEKKKIVVTGQFDFDSTSPSDFESSLTQSTEQLSISDTKTPPSRPPRPKSQRSRGETPKQISAIELQQQLLEIDNRLTDLELRGRDLEDSIRNASLQQEGEEEDEEEDDRLMMEWFQLVSEKNDLVRKEVELVYVSREQDLQDEQGLLDSQLRYLMNKDELTMSPQEKEEEAYLLQRKLDIVNQRSSIIDSMDEDRLRYEEEDSVIEDMLKSKGLWKDDGTLLAEKGKKVANATFYA